MRLGARVRAGNAVLLVLAIGLALFASPRPVAAESDDTVTTVLQPGLNLAGWTEEAAPVETIFERIPELLMVYSWDADFQRFRLAVRADPDGFGDLRMLTPGMGLWLWIAGDEPVTWTRPLVRSTSGSQLHAGWNLVVWAGEDRAVARDVLADIDDILELAADGQGRALRTLNRGQAFWVDLSSGGRNWDQLYEPPRIEFVSSLPPQQEQEVRDHIDDVVAYYFQRLGFRVPGVTVRYADPELFGCSGNYRAPVINMTDCLKIFAHEYVHAIQQHLTAGGRHPPLWFRRVTQTSGQRYTPMRVARGTTHSMYANLSFRRRERRASYRRGIATRVTTYAFTCSSNVKAPKGSRSSTGGRRNLGTGRPRFKTSTE
jgi:hypothetical protein